jgi:protein-S-isoprenylcysteine O-methyltransferase Ste14
MSRPAGRRRDVPAPAAGARATGGFWLAVVSFVVLIAATLFVPARPAPLMRGVALGLVAAGVVFAGLPVIQRRRRAVPAGGGDGAALASDGLYAVVRHPQYLGFDLLAWGLATLALYWGTILPAIAFTAGLAVQARAEEDFLLERFGEAYRTYRHTVPRFGPLTGFVRYLRRRRAPPRE